MDIIRQTIAWKLDEDNGQFTMHLVMDTPFYKTYTSSSLDDILEKLDEIVEELSLLRKKRHSVDSKTADPLSGAFARIKNDILNGERKG